MQTYRSPYQNYTYQKRYQRYLLKAVLNVCLLKDISKVYISIDLSIAISNIFISRHTGVLHESCPLTVFYGRSRNRESKKRAVVPFWLLYRKLVWSHSRQVSPISAWIVDADLSLKEGKICICPTRLLMQAWWHSNICISQEIARPRKTEIKEKWQSRRLQRRSVEWKTSYNVSEFESWLPRFK